jgi:hypothetical protein
MTAEACVPQKSSAVTDRRYRKTWQPEAGYSRFGSFAVSAVPLGFFS